MTLLLWTGSALAAGAAVTGLIVKGEAINVVSDIWSAYGTTAAAVVALVLGLQSALYAQSEAAHRRSAAAIFISQNLFTVRAALDVVQASEIKLRADPLGYCAWLSDFSFHMRSAGPLIEDKHIDLARDLDPTDLHLLLVADDWLTLLKRLTLFRDGATLAEVHSKFDAFITELIHGYRIVALASDRMHQVSGMAGGSPWEQPAPSWVHPITPESDPTIGPPDRGPSLPAA